MSYTYCALVKIVQKNLVSYIMYPIIENLHVQIEYDYIRLKRTNS